MLQVRRAEGLREISFPTPGVRFVLRGKQSEIVPERQQAFEHGARFRPTALTLVRWHRSGFRLTTLLDEGNLQIEPEGVLTTGPWCR